MFLMIEVLRIKNTNMAFELQQHAVLAVALESVAGVFVGNSAVVITDPQQNIEVVELGIRSVH